MKKAEEELTLHLRLRPVETVSIEIPKDTLEALKKIAAHRDMSYQALLKFYIGQGLRQDLAKHFADRLLETTARVLAPHPLARGGLGHYAGNSPRSGELTLSGEQSSPHWPYGIEGDRIASSPG